MMGTISADEINYLVYRYLQESGFVHSAFTFAYESLISQSVVATQAGGDVPPGTLVAFLQKGLQLVAMEQRLNDDGSERAGADHEDFSLLTPYVCQAAGEKPLVGKAEAAAAAQWAKVAKSDENNGQEGQDSAKSQAGGGDKGGGGGKAGKGNTSGGTKAAYAPELEVSAKDVTTLKSHTSEVFCCAWNPTDGSVLATGSGDATARIWTLDSAAAASSVSDSKTATAAAAEPATSVTLVHTAPGAEDGASHTTAAGSAPASNGSAGAAAAVTASTTGEVATSAPSAPAAEAAVVASPMDVLSSSAATTSAEAHEEEVGESAAKRSRLEETASTSSASSSAAAESSSSSRSSANGLGSGAADSMSHRDSETSSRAPVQPPEVAVGSSSSTAPSSGGGVWPGGKGKGSGEHKATERDVTTLEWSRDGSLLGTGGMDGVARIFSKSGQLVRSLQGHSQSIFSMRFSPNGTKLLTGSYDYSTVVWDLSNGAAEERFQVHTGQVLDVDWKDDRTFTSCSSDHAIHMCRLGTPKPLMSFLGHKDEVNAVKWDPSGRLLASCSDDATVKLWGEASPRPLFDLREHTKEIYTIRWSPTGEGSSNPSKPLMLASASFDTAVKLWDAPTGRCVHTLSKHDKKVYTVAFSPCGEYLASGSLGGQLYVWSVKDGNLVKAYKGTSDIFEVAWNQPGLQLACCGATASNAVTIIDFRM